MSPSRDGYGRAKPAAPAKKTIAKTWFERFGWPIIALLVPITITTISAYTFNIKNERDAHLRLYSQLISQRENSESILRKDMLNTLVGKFFDSKAIYGKEITPEGIDAGVLQLELITYNFHESLQLSPLFHAVNRQLIRLQAQEPDEDRVAEIKAMSQRLLKLARKVIRKQVETLGRYGAVDDYKLSHSEIEGGFRKFGIIKGFENIIDESNAAMGRDQLDRSLARNAWNPEIKQVVIEMLLEESKDPQLRDMLVSVLAYAEYDTMWDALWDSVTIVADDGDSSRTIEVYEAVAASVAALDSDEPVPVGPFQIDHVVSLGFTAGDSVHVMRGTLEIIDVDEAFHEVGIRLGTVQCVHPVNEGTLDHSNCPTPPVNLERQGGFHVGVFDFPLIDNTRLVGDRRFAVYIKGWSDDEDPEIELGFALFPGYVASLREKSYFKDIMERLRVD